jgi:endonuclease YncB( thermonuclease family)
VVFLGRAGEAEREARAAGRGLWADKAPVAPWECRASERGRKGEAAGR